MESDRRELIKKIVTAGVALRIERAEVFKNQQKAPKRAAKTIPTEV